MSSGELLEFEVKYLFGLNSKKSAQCMVCYRTVSHVRKYNIERHYLTRHKQEYAKYEKEERERLVRKLKEAFTEKINKEALLKDLSNEPSPQMMQITENPIKTEMSETPTFEIKSESPVDVQLEAETIFTIPSEEVASVEFLPPSDNHIEPAYAQHEVVDRFVIYELESAAPDEATTATASTPTISSTPIPTTTILRSTPTKPAPKLLNAKFRKRPLLADATTGNEESTAPDVKLQHIAMPLTSASVNCLSVLPEVVVSTAAAETSTTVTELKVKCFCRLSNRADNATPANGLELKDFYTRMFNETRKLSQKQQRAVKISLLNVICQAEEDVEAGRFCEKCCSL